METEMRSPLSRVRGLGSAHKGTGHFIAQRVTAAALLLLGPWFVLSTAYDLRGGFQEVRLWIGQPLVAVPMLLFVGAALYHMQIGMQTIIEDYIHKSGTKALLLIANTFLAILLAAASAFSIIEISLGI